MSPAPSRKHQRIAGDIYGEMWSYLREKNCQVFSAPFDVRLPVSLKKGKTDTVVQPDITVVCNENILDEQGCNGVPNLVVEVLSPGNTKREMREKFNLYQEAGVKEYWLVHPTDENIFIYSLNNEGVYIGSRHYVEGDLIKSAALQGFELKVSNIFAN